MSEPPKPLPDDPMLRAIALVKRSAPNPTRPRLSDEAESRLHGVERESASCYASIEDAVDKFRKLAARLDEDDEDDDETQRKEPEDAGG